MMVRISPYDYFLGSAPTWLQKVKYCYRGIYLLMRFISQGNSSGGGNPTKNPKYPLPSCLRFSLVSTCSLPIALGLHAHETTSGWPQSLLCVRLLFTSPARQRTHWFRKLVSLSETFWVMSWLVKEAHVHQKHQSRWGTSSLSSLPQSLFLNVSSDSFYPNPVPTKSFPLIAMEGIK